ncbi:uncharacterized protein LOC133183964 [Saccostrea echinata]|uniref:uncharacterized protein LOC133183964 n=1 Tax=Saccostrea echinata TaxID=191078 RepID=UPI002A840266|nr:uncharacterized protein LOC133183964 [Saccostrea echinata]
MEFFFGLVVFLSYMYYTDAHGRMIDPPMRSSMWRVGFETPKNYNDNELNCGGFVEMMEKANGKCGICGDPYLGPRENEAGGKYALGIITKQYKVGSVINVTIELTTNHRGYFEFRLCPQNDPYTPITEACLDKHVLNIIGYGKRFMLYDEKTVMVDLQLMLPPHLRCSQCVLQWKWRAAQNRGIDKRTGKECFGCGPQEYFVNCADIAIGDKAINRIPKPAAKRAQVTMKPKVPKLTVTRTKITKQQIPKVAQTPYTDVAQQYQPHQYNEAVFNNENFQESLADRVFLDLIGQSTLFIDPSPHFEAINNRQPAQNQFNAQASTNQNFGPAYNPFFNDFIAPNEPSLLDFNSAGISRQPGPSTSHAAAAGQYYTAQSVMATAAILSTLAGGETGGDNAYIECPESAQPTCKGNTMWGEGRSNDRFCSSICPQGHCPMSMCMCTCPARKRIFVKGNTSPSNTGQRCFAIDAWDQHTNNLCVRNCKPNQMDFCPSDICTCEMWGI